MIGFNSNLPLVFISTFGKEVPKDEKLPASMRIIDTKGGRASLTGPADFEGRRRTIGAPPGAPVIAAADGGELAVVAIAVGQDEILSRPHPLDQRLQRELGVADQGITDAEIFVQVSRIEGGVNDRLALRHGYAVVGGGEAAADAQDHIGIPQELEDRFGDGSAARAERQRMRLGERALALQARGDRTLEQLGERLELRPGLGVVDALPGVDHRPLGGDERRGDPRNVLRIGRDLEARRGLVAQRLRHVFTEQAHRKLDEHRPGPAVAHLRERAAHRIGDDRRQDDLLRGEYEGGAWDPDVEVINAGVPGYTTDQEATYLELRGLALEPDAIVLNDGLSNGSFVQLYARREKPLTYFRSGSSAWRSPRTLSSEPAPTASRSACCSSRAPGTAGSRFARATRSSRNCAS